MIVGAGVPALDPVEAICVCKAHTCYIRNQQHLKMRFGSFLRDDGEPNEENIAKVLFIKIFSRVNAHLCQ